jgi:murein DD-endopeptidase MepM/ murein hydrolase activator NlpD
MGPIPKIALLSALIAVPLLAGCMPDTPRTHLEWGVNDTLHRHVASRDSAKTYAYQDKDARPAPRPAVSRFYAPVTSGSLAPIGDVPSFSWPVRGRVISDFGATANGGKNDGINIAASLGTPIHASASGTVTYAGNALKDYGNLLLLKHTGGYTTAYAHADRLVVARGDVVTRDQVIGYAGQTGDVSSPQLHFEIRSSTTPVNPHSYLSAMTARN